MREKKKKRKRKASESYNVYCTEVVVSMARLV